MKEQQRIKHPAWLLGAGEAIQSTLRLYADNRIPQSIEVWMVRTPLLRALRGIYGSDLRAAWFLLRHALWMYLLSHFDYLLIWWRVKVLRRSFEVPK